MSNDRPAYAGPLFQPHSPTSQKAAEAIAPHAGNLREVVYALFSSRGWTGLTDEEGYVLLEMSPSTFRPRRIELVNAGRIRNSGRTRHTASGCKAVVWMVQSSGAPDAGLAAHADGGGAVPQQLGRHARG